MFVRHMTVRRVLLISAWMTAVSLAAGVAACRREDHMAKSGSDQPGYARPEDQNVGVTPARSEPSRNAPTGPVWDGPSRSLILITLDTTRADHLSCYGGPAGLTPRMDAFAESGVLFLTRRSRNQTGDWTRLLARVQFAQSPANAGTFITCFDRYSFCGVRATNVWPAKIRDRLAARSFMLAPIPRGEGFFVVFADQFVANLHTISRVRD